MIEHDGCTDCLYDSNSEDSYPCRECRGTKPIGQAEYYAAPDHFAPADPDSAPAGDNVNHPAHYEASCSLECIEAMRIALGSEGVLQFCLGNAFKYLWRHKHKNGLEDLHKAEWYCNYASQLPDFYVSSGAGGKAQTTLPDILISSKVRSRAQTALPELRIAIKEAQKKWEEAHKE